MDTYTFNSKDYDKLFVLRCGLWNMQVFVTKFIQSGLDQFNMNLLTS